MTDNKNPYKDYINKNFKKDERRRKYLESDVKRGKIIVDAKNEKVVFVSSKEVSLEKLHDNGIDFIDEGSDSAQFIEKVERIKMLYAALDMLEEAERELIMELYFIRKSEELCARCRNISQPSLHKRKMNVLIKLRNLFDDM